MAETLEQKAEEANERFADKFRKEIEARGYSFHSYVSDIRAQEMKAGRFLSEKESAPCLVVSLNSIYSKPLMRIETVKAFFNIFNPFEGLKVYVEGSDREKKKEDPFILGKD